MNELSTVLLDAGAGFRKVALSGFVYIKVVTSFLAGCAHGSGNFLWLVSLKVWQTLKCIWRALSQRLLASLIPCFELRRIEIGRGLALQGE